jgi:hypothetical protein
VLSRVSSSSIRAAADPERHRLSLTRGWYSSRPSGAIRRRGVGGDSGPRALLSQWSATGWWTPKPQAALLAIADDHDGGAALVSTDFWLFARSTTVPDRELLHLRDRDETHPLMWMCNAWPEREADGGEMFSGVHRTSQMIDGVWL